MKQKDIALIIVIAAVSGAVAFAVSHLLFAAPQDRQQSVAVVKPITTTFQTPSQNSQFFNSQSIDPTQLIRVQSNNNTNPFNGSNH